MAPETIVNIAALEPLYQPHEEPTHHRVRAKSNRLTNPYVKLFPYGVRCGRR
ncbi:MAG: hypothetical protein WA003_11890 [Desulfuromonadaceae bacterium]